METKNFVKKIFGKNSNLIFILIAMLVAGISYWTKPYGKMDTETVYILWTSSAFVTASIFTSISPKKIITHTLLTTAGFEIAIILRAIYDITFVDPTSHSLIPFELVIFGLLAFISALGGAFIMHMIKRLIVNSQK